MIRNQLESSRINAVHSFKHKPCRTAVGLTRQSIFMRRRWTRGSSPRVTARRGGSTSSGYALALNPSYSNFLKPQCRSNGPLWRRYIRIALHARAEDERRRKSDLVYRDPLFREYLAGRHRKVGRRVALPRGTGVRLRDGPFGHAPRAWAPPDRGGAISGARRA